ncbi:CDP-glucose 4,6-dehydratase [Laspinema olomoucense]|uniref:CDP-glucose 4,6-dehydratase n=1 Tax=Laspinema olomoucense TaxID=3231600 RepID=UPI0021BB5E8C|nr:CDP-glucose 4,6-dehydratase [Laspinema sp. D3c]MCT7995213.1 CDP-glucose 4,6-dehydratase [Laspinema sp. D3c]
MEPSFWQGKRVFLTGHTGFKGSWLALWLQSLGASVVGYALEPATQPNLFQLARVAEGMTSVFGDIRELPRLKQVMAEFSPEIVFHLAAQALVRESYQNPVDTYATNVMGTVNLLEAVRQIKGVRAVVNVTSDKCYENREWVWGYRETEPLGGYDPYSSSKACAELVTGAYRNSFFNVDNYLEHKLAVATARAGNVIGGGDWAIDRLVPDCLRAFEKGDLVKLRSPHAIRPWQYVIEPISGYLLLAEKLLSLEACHYACAWNFGPDAKGDATVGKLATTLAHLWGKNAGVELDSSENYPHEAGLLKLDITRVRTELGWQPCWSVKQALQATVDWHQAWLRGQDMREYSLSQIAAYQETQSTLVNAL